MYIYIRREGLEREEKGGRWRWDWDWKRRTVIESEVRTHAL
jgi:hypothetical protein